MSRKGKGVRYDHHARFYDWEHQSPAFQSLSANAVRLLLELKMLHNGRNNGAIFLSVREAARRLSVGKNLAAAMFGELQDRGFVRPNVVGAFDLKTGARRGAATSWILTEYPIGDELGAGSRDFMRWRPPAQKSFDGPSNRDRVSPIEGQVVPPGGTPPPKLSLVQGHFPQKAGSDGPSNRDTVKLPGGRGT